MDYKRRIFHIYPSWLQYVTNFFIRMILYTDIEPRPHIVHIVFWLTKLVYSKWQVIQWILSIFSLCDGQSLLVWCIQFGWNQLCWSLDGDQILQIWKEFKDRTKHRWNSCASYQSRRFFVRFKQTTCSAAGFSWLALSLIKSTFTLKMFLKLFVLWFTTAVLVLPL